MTRYVIGFDPSGSFKEGKGTTGYCVFDITKDMVIAVGTIKAIGFNSQTDYWNRHTELIEQIVNRYGKKNCVVSAEDYVLYETQAKAQINSSMETCQLIGHLKTFCATNEIPLYMRPAIMVKHRWTDTILAYRKYITRLGRTYYVDCRTGKALCEHERDAIRHAVHCALFEVPITEKENNYATGKKQRVNKRSRKS